MNHIRSCKSIIDVKRRKKCSTHFATQGCSEAKSTVFCFIAMLTPNKEAETQKHHVMTKQGTLGVITPNKAKAVLIC